MAYAIINRYIPASLYPLKAPYSMKPEYVTIHNTYNDATAANEIAYMTRNATVVGYHVAIDDKQAVQAIPFTHNAFHAGDGATGAGNRRSIGIEICYSESGGPRYVAAEENTVEYVAHLLKQYGWGIERVKWHRDWSGKKCPHRIIDEGRTQSVKDRIAKRLAELNNPKLVAIDDKKEGVSKLYEPTSKAIKDSTEEVLKQLEFGENGLSTQWRKKLNDGTLSDSDAVGLLFVAAQRGLLSK